MVTTMVPERVDSFAAERLMKENAQVLDVRTPAEFESVHIPGSYNVPLDLLSEHRNELRSVVDRPIILVCGSGLRAQQADETLRATGFEALTILDGGIQAWETNGHPVVRGQQKWSIERQVRGVAGGLVFTGAIGGLLLWKPLTLLSLFVGGGLLFSAISNTCGMAKVLAKLPYNQGASCDVRQVVSQLAADQAK
jgi:rhodanese-related sulfurtransferase